MENSITVEKGLSAYFKQPSGPSRQGVDWAVQISGERAGAVTVRTYFTSDPPNQAEEPLLAGQAIALVKQNLENGWTPEPGVLLQANDPASHSVAVPTRPWWQFW